MLLHESFRYGLDLPGRQGLTLMAILVFVRCASPYNYSSTLAGAGGLVAALIWRDNPTAAVIVLSQGIFIDLLYRQLSRSPITLWLLPVGVGFIHMIKPMLKVGLMVVAGIETDSFRHGLAYPFITHFLFGGVGALIGFMAWRSLKKHTQ
ncbi:hypothetical protein MDMS009_1572 [Methylophaga thiooxydans DMS010]|uniref:Rod shape-determining protein MreD n=2 Tax=Methylophaga thiooxydans TaxID=392484 RepID=C0N5X8_9GAMM|nr:hypothetical protein MDMS009_1572 [Methylophaga thiooxydans DMS010]